jgi:AbrB family looped-hinge helix DNA binding protein
MSARNTAKLSSKFQLSIPKAVRDENGWRAGQEFAFVPKAGGVMLVPVPTIEELFGSMKGANPDNYRDRNDRY